jgi:hypothetical protein
VPLNVAQLVQAGCVDASYDEAWSRLADQHEDDASPIAFDRDEAELHAKYTAVFGDYALSFEHAVSEAGAALSAPVNIAVHADADPESEWWREGARRNPTEYEGDPLVWRPWSLAYEAVGAPSVESVTSL